MAKFFDQKKQVDPNNANNITSVMVSKTGLHAFRVADHEKVQEYYDYLLSGNYKGFKYHKEKYDKGVVKDAYKQCNNCLLIELDTWLTENFMKFFNWADTGLDYFFAQHPVEPDGDYVWIKQN